MENAFMFAALIPPRPEWDEILIFSALGFSVVMIILLMISFVMGGVGRLFVLAESVRKSAAEKKAVLKNTVPEEVLILLQKNFLVNTKRHQIFLMLLLKVTRKRYLPLTVQYVCLEMDLYQSLIYYPLTVFCSAADYLCRKNCISTL